MRLAVFAIALMMAGCAAPPQDDVPTGLGGASQKLLAILPVDEVFVAASDGMRLHHAVFRPDTDEPVPVFINFSPYWGNTAEERGDAFGQYLVEEYVPRGYAVVLAAIRGTGHSEGCFEVASDREVQDLYEVIDHFAKAPWSNGNVAAGGKSYDSTTQNGLIAKMPHPALKAVFHVSGITDMYRYNYVNGVAYQNGLTFTPRYATQYSQDGDHPEGDQQQLIEMACPEMAEHVASGTGSAVHGLKDDYWIERDWTRYISDSDWNGSIFFVHGLQDWNVKPDHILPWIDNLPPQIRVKGWLHQDTFPGSGGHVYPMRTDWNETMLAWLDAELKGIGNGFWNGPAWEVQGTDGLWRQSAVWPGEAVSRQPDSVQASDPPALVFVFDEPTRMAGAPMLTIGATAPNPGSILTAVFEKNGEWVGEAVLRAAYRDGLDAPALPTAGQAAYRLAAYPLDVVFDAGDRLTITLGAQARHSMTMGLTAGVSYNTGTATLEAHFVGIDAPMDQPAPMPCITC